MMTVAAVALGIAAGLTLAAILICALKAYENWLARRGRR